MTDGQAERGGHNGDGYRLARPGPGSDRRVARGTRTRQLLIDAVIDLIGAGQSAPTARQVAARADVAVRTVFHHFDGLDDLYCQAVDRHVTRVRSSIVTVPPRGPLDVRIALIVHQRCLLFETIGPVLRASTSREPGIPALTKVLEGQRWAMDQELARSLAPELDARGPQGRSLLTTVGAVSGWSQWITLRFEAGQSAPEAERTMVDLVAWVLGGAPAHSVEVTRSGGGPDPTRASD